jgi:DNA invertase Pin-like site-specific DNA recombinase
MITKKISNRHKVTYLTLINIADDIQRNISVAETCRKNNISRDTFYRYLNNEPDFTELILRAYKYQSELPTPFFSTR